MKTFFYSISFLALLSSPVSCVMEEMNYYNQQSANKEGDSNSDGNSTTGLDGNANITTNTTNVAIIDPPIMPTKP